MSTETNDMHPVTRKELREELAASEARLEARLDAKLDAKLSTFAGAIFAAMRAMHDELKHELAASERRLMTELGAHTRASTEELTARVAVVDEKYQDLPARVARLEAIAPAPKRRARKS